VSGWHEFTVTSGWQLTLMSRTDCGVGGRIGELYPVIPGQLYFTVHKDEAQTLGQATIHSDASFFTTESHRDYTSFAADFGPVHSSSVRSLGLLAAEEGVLPDSV